MVEEFREAGVDPDGFWLRGKGSIDEDSRSVPCPVCCAPGRAAVLPGVLGRILVAESLRPTAELMAALRDDVQEARKLWIIDGGRSLRLEGYALLKDGTVGADEYTDFIASPKQLGEDLRIRTGVSATRRHLAA